MSFASLYRVSFYTMLVFATLVLSIDPSDMPYAHGLPGRGRGRGAWWRS